MTEPVQELLSLLQLARRAREANSPEALGFVMVNESLQVLHYRQAALWRDDAVLGKGHVAAVSGLPQPSPGAPYTQWLTRLCRVLRESADGGGVRSFTAGDFPALADEWSEWWPAHALWLPLRHGDAAPAGALLFASETAWEEHDIAIARELGATYAHALSAFTQRRPATWRRAGTSLRRHRWAWIVALGIALFPVRQSVLAPAEVIPKDPFLVRAPQDGVVDRVLVQPNQPVKAGTPLFALDRAAVETRHAIARKAYEAAQEEYRQSAQMAVTDDKGRLEMLLRRGAVEEKGVELAYTAELLGRVQVAAERDGIAVFSDVNDWQGKTVAQGERVVTLADPAQVELAVDLPVGERFDVRPGAVVTLYPNASPLSSYEATVTRVAYTAEAGRDGQMAYRLKARFAADVPLPRIGLMGTARLQGSRVPLVYFALRRPLTAMRQWLGW